jgi:hypothetical protein
MGQVEPQIIDDIFTALDRQVEVCAGDALGLVVCGGTALAALGLVMRTTKDVDVLAMVLDTKNGLVIQKITEFPGWLIEAANKVGRDFDLPENWLNLGTASQVESGLPEGFDERLVKRRYGKYLTIYFISRIDQIHFKLYAAVDRGEHHVQDLKTLKPTQEELERAAEWVITQDVSDVFKSLLKDFLEVQGYGAIAERI